MSMKGLPAFMWLNSDKLVATAWKEAIAGKAVSVPGWQYQLLSFVVHSTPRALVRKIGMNVRIKQRQK
jgi:short-subunit dehydrogenase